MSTDLVARTEVLINTSPEKVWEGLTKPEIVKEYMFGTELRSDFQVGSPITYVGEWEGKTYEDKGVILKSEPSKLLSHTYWSSVGSTPDLPENYYTITYTLTPVENGTKLLIEQSGSKDEEAKSNSEGNWNMVLKTLKDILEKA